MLMLALQRDHRPVSSATLAAVLDVSDAYLKKTLTTMVGAGLVRAVQGRDGGYVLARPLADVTIADVVRALDPMETPDACDALARAVYGSSDHLESTLSMIHAVFHEADGDWLARLSTVPLSALVIPEAAEHGAIDWRERASRS